MKRLITGLAALTLLLAPAADAGTNGGSPFFGGAGSGGTPGTACNTSIPACAATTGYVKVTDFPGHTGGGVVGGGSGDDEPPMLNAATAACNSGQKLVNFPPGKYNMQTQFNSPCNGLVFFGTSENISYDPENNPNAAVLVYINSGFFTSANHIWYNYNGKTDNVWWSINIAGDGGQNGTSAFGTSFNYVGVGQIPRAYIFDSGIGGQGTAIGCGINITGGTSTFAAPYTGTGTTCANYMGYRLFNVNADENFVAANGNITDMFWRGGTISGNACGGIVGANVGTEGMVIYPDTIEENGGAAEVNICALGGPGLEINGPLWQVNTRFQANGGTDITFDGSCAADTISGSYSGSGAAGTQGNESIIAFKASCDKTISFNGFAGGSGKNSLVAPKYFAENVSGTNQISIVGGNVTSTQYSIAMTNTVAGSLTYEHLLTLGQTPGVSNAAQNAFTVTSSNSNAACIELIPTDSGSDHQAGFCASGSGNEAGTQWDFMTDANSGANLYAWQFSKFTMAGNFTFGWNSSSNDALANSAVADTTLTRSGPAMVATNGAIVNKGTHYTVTGGSYVSGGATAGTFTSSTTGTMSAVITFNGATGLTAPTGWDCHATDFTTAADALLQKQTASSTTTATITGTTVSADVISFSCTPY